MKKKIAIIVAASMLFGGVVSAASMWGTYKGNPIIRLTVNGSPIKTGDVPAISYNGRTMIPVNLLQQAGVTYTFDSKNQTVDIKQQTFDVAKIKSYAVLMDYYAALNTLGSRFTQTQSLLTNDLSYLRANLTPQAILTHSNNAVNDLVNEYNRLQAFEKDKLAVATSISQLEPAIDQALLGYSSAIDSLKAAVTSLGAYNTDTDFSTKFFDNLEKAATSVSTSENLVMNGYTKYFNLIQGSTVTYVQPQINTAPDLSTPITGATTFSTVNSKIDGDFDGFENGKIFKLQNGQIWQQTDYTYKYSYKYAPKVTIYKDGTKFKMIVDGVDKTVTVERLK
ncbi:stalk domain-containing protein [Cohnella sp. GCM10012308]|uniref:stalk domain-containing protein n=1 Tax=Cohnella sp. GCM10012308 TaxID=3317329 RepID=UPI00360C2CD7